MVDCKDPAYMMFGNEVRNDHYDKYFSSGTNIIHRVYSSNMIQVLYQIPI